MPSSQTPPVPVRQVSALTGALVGLLATAPLIAILYVGNQALLLPQPFFELFDRVSRILPGAVVTFGIDTMVSVFSKLPGVSTDVASKAAEQSLAIGQFLVLGAIVGAIIAFAYTRTRRSASGISGAYLGIGVAVVPLLLTLLMENANSGNADGPITASSWIILLYVAWGMIVGGVLEALAIRRAAELAQPIVSAAPSASRRTFLAQFGGGAVVLTLVGWGAGRLLGQASAASTPAVADLPTQTPMPTGAPGQPPAFAAAPGTRLEVTPNNQFYRVDINTDPPHVDQAAYKLTVGGSVDTPLALSYDELRKLPVTEFDATLECISNPVGGGLISSTRWTGVKLADLLKKAGVKTSAVAVRFTSADGYVEALPMKSALDDHTLLAYATNGQALAPEHGFPLRLYTPDRYGMKNPKWITTIDAIDTDMTGYWTDRGWVKEAFVKSTSVIDTIATDQASAGVVPVGGIAFGGGRGISKVEISVDNGAWQSVTLKAPISPLTWRLWRFDWQAPKGYHTLVVRATDGNAEVQIQQEAPLHPSGASGYVSKTVTIA